MKFQVEDEFFDVVITKKANKNTYIRVKNDMKIYVTTNFFATKGSIKRLLDNNYDAILKMLTRQKKLAEKNNMFFYLGNSYDIITISTVDSVEIDNNYIYTKDLKMLDKWYKNQIIKIFTDRYNYISSIFDENILKPKLKIRTMKTRWGVYNRKNHSITLNSKLIEYDLPIIDYVIIHELSHIIHFDHSKNFWSLVNKYCPNYKIFRKQLKE